ncbi:hypothetical protein quinque_000081 [Culex quinquefasciatus]
MKARSIMETALVLIDAIASPIIQGFEQRKRNDELEYRQRTFEQDQMKFNELSGRKYQELSNDFHTSKHEQDRFNVAISGRFSGLKRDYGRFRRDQDAFNAHTMRLYGEFQQQYKQDWSKQLDFNKVATDRLQSLDKRTLGLEEAHKSLRDELGYVTNRAEKHYEMARAFNEQTDRHLRSLDGRSEDLWRRLEEQKSLFKIVGLGVVLIAGYLYKKHAG